MKRGADIFVGKEKLKPGLADLIPELRGREKEFPADVPDYRREIPGDFCSDPVKEDER